MPVPSVSLALPHWLESHSQWMWIPRHPPDTWLQLWTPSPHHCSTPHRYQHHQCCANCDKSHLQESSAYQPTKSSSLEYFSVYVVNYVLARAHDPHKVGPMHFRFKTINHTVVVSTICGSCTLLHSLLLRPQGRSESAFSQAWPGNKAPRAWPGNKTSRAWPGNKARA